MVRGELSVGDIARAGHDIVLAEGLGAVSMRRVADALGVWPTSIYHHVGSKDGLVQLVLDTVLGELAVPDAALSWDAWLRAFAGVARDVLLAHPGVAAHLVERGNYSPPALALTDRAVGVLRRDGFGDRDAAVVYVDFLGFVFARVRREEDLRDGRDGQWGARVRLDEEDAELPNLRALEGVWQAITPAEYLEEGVEIFVRGADALRRS